jgi:cyanate permease
MRRVWASLVAVWATLAIVAVLAWSHVPTPVQPQAAQQTLVLKGKNGKSRVVVVKSNATPVTTTHSSPPPP